MKKDIFRDLVKAGSAGIIVSVIAILVVFNYLISINANNNSNSRLIKTANNPTVYYVSQGGSKIPFPNADIFLSYKNKWQDIQVVSEAEVNIYPDAQYIKLVNGKKIYRLQNNVKRLVDDKQVKLMGIPDWQVVVVNKKEFDFYKIGKKVASDEINNSQKNNSETENKCTPDSQAGGVEGCKIFTALGKEDISLCYEIENENWRAKCFESMPLATEKVLASCNSLSAESLRANCISQVAFKAQDVQICRGIKLNSERNFCESKIAIQKKSGSACDNLASDDSEVGKNYCWFIVGTVQNSLKACDKISETSKYKTGCETIINNKLVVQEVLKPLRTSLLASILKIKSAKAQSALTGEISVGGKFLPGAFDIYTPTPIPACMLVTVVGPKPGTFNFIPTFIYDYFLATPTHINLNMLGLARIFPPCPPTIYLVGSGMVPVE